jgi:hypothetical protein
MTRLTAQAGARRAFGLGTHEAVALWQTPEGDWVAVARGRQSPFALYNLLEWDDAAGADAVELTADADGRVRRRGEPAGPGDPAWVVPQAVRAGALAPAVAREAADGRPAARA